MSCCFDALAACSRVAETARQLGSQVRIFRPVGGANFLELAKGIQDFELHVLVQQGLMVVGAVHIHQHIAEPFQDLQGHRLIIHKGLVRRLGDYPADDEQTAITGFQPDLFENGINKGGV